MNYPHQGREMILAVMTAISDHIESNLTPLSSRLHCCPHGRYTGQYNATTSRVHYHATFDVDINGNLGEFRVFVARSARMLRSQPPDGGRSAIIASQRLFAAGNSAPAHKRSRAARLHEWQWSDERITGEKSLERSNEVAIFRTCASRRGRRQISRLLSTRPQSCRLQDQH